MPQQKKLNNENKGKKELKSNTAEKKEVVTANTNEEVKKETAKVEQSKQPTAKKAEKTTKKEQNTKEENKTVKKPEVKEVKSVKKVKKRVVKEKVSKSEGAKSNAKKIKKKKPLPKFVGRFGKKFIRRKSVNKKWAKWRKPRGIDIYNLKEDGAMPDPGYGNSKDIRGLHPSGYKEVLIHNAKELDRINPSLEAVKISSTVGLRKRNEIVSKANDMKVKVLN